MSNVKQVYFDDLIVDHTYCVQCSGVRTYHKIVTKTNDEVSMQTVMRDGTPHPQVPGPETFSREVWATFRWGRQYGVMYEYIEGERGDPVLTGDGDHHEI